MPESNARRRYVYPWVVGAIVVIGLLVLTVWVLQQALAESDVRVQEQAQEMQSDDTSTQKWVESAQSLNGREQGLVGSEQMSTATPSVDEAEQADNNGHVGASSSPLMVPTRLTYNNTDYGFRLYLPRRWEGYNTRTRTMDWAEFGTSPAIDLGFARQPEMITVFVLSSTQWAFMQRAEDPSIGLPAFMGTNERHVFAYSIKPYAANVTLKELLTDGPAIINSFDAL